MRGAVRACRLLAPLALAVTLAFPAAMADTERGSGVGMNLGFVQPGTWDIYHFATSGGAIQLDLTWASSLFPFADYDLRLYRPGALDDNTLTDDELLTHSSNSGGTFERINAGLAAGTYVVAVAPFQAQNEQYTLRSNVGDLRFAATALGTQGSA